MNHSTFLIALFLSCRAQAFVPSTPIHPHARFGISARTSLRNGNIEQIEFKIYPDGRIEETVRGIKGGQCHKITEEINNNLGKVTTSQPTEEMYEQEIIINQNVEVTNNFESGWEGSSSW